MVNSRFFAGFHQTFFLESPSFLPVKQQFSDSFVGKKKQIFSSLFLLIQPLLPVKHTFLLVKPSLRVKYSSTIRNHLNKTTTFPCWPPIKPIIFPCPLHGPDAEAVPPEGPAAMFDRGRRTTGAGTAGAGLRGGGKGLGGAKRQGRRLRTLRRLRNVGMGVWHWWDLLEMSCFGPWYWRCWTYLSLSLPTYIYIYTYIYISYIIYHIIYHISYIQYLFSLGYLYIYTISMSYKKTIYIHIYI